MAGYNGHRMSNNAVAAYAGGEMPISKWTKAAIMEQISGYIEEESKVEMLEKLTAKELKDAFLRRSSWHHTSLFYNCTDFYALNMEAVEAITKEDVERIISDRKRVKRSAEDIEAEKQKKAERKAEKEAKEEKERLFRYQKQYKSLSGFMKSKTVDLEKLRKIRLEKIADRREQLRQVWEAQNYEYGLAKIENDDFIEQYIK